MSEHVGRIAEAWSPEARIAAARARALKARNGINVEVGHHLSPAPEVASKMERKVSGRVNHVGPTYVSVTPLHPSGIPTGGPPELLTHDDVATYYHARVPNPTRQPPPGHRGPWHPPEGRRSPGAKRG